jgi:3-dehydro-4-phosphotetronate decarboxylase
MSAEASIREAIVAVGASLYQRGLSPGSSGNISARVDDGWIVTPTDTALGQLDPAELCKIDDSGRAAAGPKPTKEVPLHLAFYGQRSAARAIVHLHATHSAAVSCLAGLDVTDCLPPLTPYHVLKVGPVPLIAYHPPGDPALTEAVALHAHGARAVLLANHGPVVSGTTLREAAAAAEELEETAKLYLLLRGAPTRPLSAAEVTRLRSR